MWGWILLALVVSGCALQMLAFVKRCAGHGKYITFPMVKMYAKWSGKRFAKKYHREHPDEKEFSRTWFVMPSTVRVCQIFALLAIYLWFLGLSFAGVNLPILEINCLVYWLPFVALYADDLLSTIDKDKWKKRWSSAKNKIKWKMTLPVPIPTR